LILTISTIGTAQKLVSDIVVQDNKKTKASFIKKIIRMKEGMQLDSTLVQADVEQLIRLPSIAHAYYQVHENETGYKVVYGIQENFTIIPFANIFTSNDNEFAFRVGLQEFNFLGENMTLGAFYQYDVFSSFGLNLRAPFLFSRHLGVAVNYQNLVTQEPVFLDNGTADYRYQNESLEILALYQINYKNRFEFGINIFNEDYEYLRGATSPDVPQALDVDKFLYKFIYDFDGIKYFYHYLSGFRSTLNLQFVQSKDNALPNFTIGFNDFTYFSRLGTKGNWATRLRLGLSSNIDTPFAPFAVDNNLNIRGVGNSIDRGTAAIVVNTEYRHTLMDRDWFVLQSNVFIDGGSWRNPGGDFGDFGDNQNLRVYPGVGVRFIHKRIFNAILRVDYGYGITRDATRGIVFGIGQYF
jgi:outer membrane protein assembly factor BamA